MAVCLVSVPLAPAGAKIIISELLWSGSDLSSADEWIELANTGSGTVSLSGWTLTRMSNGNETPMLTLPAESSMGSGGYFLIGNFGESSSRLSVEPHVTDSAVSLTNTQLFLWLYDDNGTLMDTVDDGIGVPFAGSNALPKASMEKIDLAGSGQVKSNWQTAFTFVNVDDGAPLRGTPGAANGSGPSDDTFPPKEATHFVAEVPQGTQSGTVAITWTPSISFDLSSQHITWNGTGITLPATITGITLNGIGTGVTFVLRSTDLLGNTSSGTSTISVFSPHMRITEVLANPAGADDAEWIELANLGSQSVNIGGWILDEGNSPGNFTFPSPFILDPFEHRAFPKTMTNLPLGNNGETITLKRGSVVMDTWTYSETAEEVSYGRLGTDASIFQAFCVPTMHKPNDIVEPNPIITIQSGTITGERSVTLNLIAEVQTGSTAHASCRWNYSDGYASESCNPPSHTFDAVGTYDIVLTYADFCGNSIVRSITATVTGASSGNSGQAGGAPTGGGSGTGGGGGGGKESGNRTSCTPERSEGIRISEVLPNPEGDDATFEWIELENTLTVNASLCGWTLDDGEGGSKPFVLDAFTIAPQSFLLLERTKTKIALNNSDESVRLFDPHGEEEHRLSYATSEEGESFALRDDGLFVWTPFQTPGSKNVFRTAERQQSGAAVIVSAAMPNPAGKDTGNEWIELTNIGLVPVDLFGWSLANAKGKSYELPKSKLNPKEVRRFMSDITNIALTNTMDEARLYDPLGTLVSLLSWSNAVSGRTYFPSQAGKRITVRVVAVIDGDTIDVTIEGKRERVRMIGVDTPETVHPKKAVETFGKEASEFTKSTLMGKTVTLEFGEEERDKYGRILAYIFLSDGTNVNGELIRRGYGYAYLRFPFALSALFSAYEAEARKAKLGLWADEEAASEAEETKTLIEAEKEQEKSSGTGSSASGTSLSGATLIAETSVIADELPTAPPAENPFSEVMSNPPKNGFLHDLGEYVELFNAEDERVSLKGWILDDDPSGSSKPKILNEEYVIEPNGFLLLCKGVQCDLPISVSLNNEGEVLSLTSPDGEQIFSIAYPAMKPGESYSRQEGEWCVSLSPSPRALHDCQQSRNIEQSRTSKEISASMNIVRQNPVNALKKKYRNIVPKNDEATNDQHSIHPLLMALRQEVRNTHEGSGTLEQQRAALHMSAVATAMFLCVGGTAFSRRKALSPAPQNTAIPV